MFFSFLLLESLDDGTSPPRYLVDGLKELVYSFKEWTRTREVRMGVGFSQRYGVYRLIPTEVRG